MPQPRPLQRRPLRRGALTLATGVALALGSCVLSVLPAQAATAAGATAPSGKHLHDDYNGDGFPDVAIGAPDTALGARRNAGAITVLYGSAKGLSKSGRQVLTWSSRTSAASPQTKYGSTLRSADLDQDGYADLLSTVSWTPPGGRAGTAIVVDWGGPKGLSAEPTLLPSAPDGPPVEDFAVADVDGDGHPDVVQVGIRTTATPQDGSVLHGPFTRTAPAGSRTTYFDVDPDRYLWSRSLAAGDVNGDGIADIAVRTSDPEEPDSRGVALLLGGRDGFTRKGELKDTQGHRVGGEEVAIGDLNKDHYADIVVGHHDDRYDSDLELPTVGGAVAVVYGGAAGTSTTLKPVWINQDTPGVPGAGERGDGMGTGVSIGDTDGDGYADVATGVPGETYDGIARAGTVLVLRGGAKGLTGTGARSFGQNTSGVPGVAEKDDRFGTSTALVDADGDRKAEFVVGDPAENGSDGAVWVFPGTSATGSFSFGAATVGLPASKSGFGATLGG
ncbi:FG-GAP and VCBS repeat-containing protein [Streptomyces sp. NPDC005573]|uniref:FG-GAP and VCBS repeat-containing protein n=1 Tax=Streptomyces sp. NPDC005573 TaxID=3156890 RepID=UPI0033B61C2A